MDARRLHRGRWNEAVLLARDREDGLRGDLHLDTATIGGDAIVPVIFGNETVDEHRGHGLGGLHLALGPHFRDDAHLPVIHHPCHQPGVRLLELDEHALSHVRFQIHVDSFPFASGNLETFRHENKCSLATIDPRARTTSILLASRLMYASLEERAYPVVLSMRSHAIDSG